MTRLTFDISLSMKSHHVARRRRRRRREEGKGGGRRGRVGTVPPECRRRWRASN